MRSPKSGSRGSEESRSGRGLPPSFEAIRDANDSSPSRVGPTAPEHALAHPLTPIFEPSSVAVIGASQDPRKRGHQVVRALLASGFRGTIVPVNPKGGELLGLRVQPSVEALEEPPDLAYVATPASAAPEVVEVCGRSGIRGAVVPAVGFRESGVEGAALESALREAAARTGIRVLGPNTSGILNTALGLNVVGGEAPPAGHLALLAQSGNVALDFMTQAARRPIGVSIYAGLGNETDLAFHECLDFLAGHEPTRAILIYVEAFREGQALLDTARRVSRVKPIVLLKGGRTAEGGRAARSHTGAVAGSYPVFRAAMRQAGIVEVTRSDELLPVAEMLAAQPPVPAGVGVVVVSDGGGHGTISADALAALQVPLARLAEETRAELSSFLGPAASTGNPIDVAGAADREPGVLARTIETVLADQACGGVVVTGLFGGYAVRFDESLADAELEAARQVIRVARAEGRPVVLHTLYASRRTEPLECLLGGGIPVHASLETALSCLSAAVRRGTDLARPAHRPQGRKPQAGRAVTGNIAALTEVEARDLVSGHGVPLVSAVFCRSDEEVERAATAFERVAVKLVAGSLPHKSEAGAVALNLAPEDASEAYRRAVRAVAGWARAGGHAEGGRGKPAGVGSESVGSPGDPAESALNTVPASPPKIDGALVSPMMPPPIAEILLGARRDRSFGPVLAVGLGGVAVELFGDVAIRVLPVRRDDVIEMLGELALAPLLGGYRGRQAVACEAIADAAVALADCLLQHPEVVELEVNPLFAYSDRAVAVDVRAYVSEL